MSSPPAWPTLQDTVNSKDDGRTFPPGAGGGLGRPEHNASAPETFPAATGEGSLPQSVSGSVYRPPHPTQVSTSVIQDPGIRNVPRFTYHYQQYEFPAEDPDDDSDKEQLLPSHQKHHLYGSVPEAPNGGRRTTSDGDISLPTKSSIEKLPFFLINLVVVLMSAAGRFHSPLMDQYLYQRFSDDLLGNASAKTSIDPCLNTTASNSSDTVRRLQQMTSQMILFLDLSNYGLGIFSCLLLGAFSNSLSRKVQLLIPTCGYLIKCVTIPVVVHWNLNVNWFYVGYAGEGALGNMCGVFLGVFLYTTDITSRDAKRTMGVAIVDGLKGVVSAGLNIVTGQLIQRTGFIIPSMLSAGCAILSMGIVLILPNRKPRLSSWETDGAQPKIQWWERVMLACSKRLDPRMRKMIALGWIAFLLTEIASSGIVKIRTLYLMNLPFCFDSIALGWFIFGRELAYNTFCILAIPLLYRCLPGMGLGILGAFSSLAGYLMYALAQTDAEIYSVPALSVGQTLPLSLIRGETSRLLGPAAQGPLFASMAVLESIGFTLGAPSLSVYRASLGFFKGLVCLIFAGMMVVVTVLLVIYHVIWRRHVKEVLTKEEEVKPVGSINA